MAIPMDQARVIRRDPASLTVSVTIAGLSTRETLAVIEALPAGISFNAASVASSITGKRFTITADSLSIKGARDLSEALLQHLERVAEGGT